MVKKKKKTSKKKVSNLFEGEVIKTADYNKAHGLVEEPALRSAAAEILAPIKEHFLNEQPSDCMECGHGCHCEDDCNKRVFTGAIKGDGNVDNESHICTCTNCQCHKKAMAKDRVIKKKKRLKSGTLRDLLDKKRFGKSKTA